MNNLLLIFQILPAIINAMKAIEEAIPQAGKGAEKLAAVRAIIESVDAAYLQYWDKIQNIIKVLTDLFNKTGVFNKSQQSAQASILGSQPSNVIKPQ